MSAVSTKSAMSAHGYFLLKHYHLFDTCFLLEAGLLPRNAYRNYNHWHNHSRPGNVRVYVVIIDGCSITVRGIRDGSSIYDVERKTTWRLSHGTIYGVNTDTWCMDLLHGPSHKIVEGIPEPEPMLSAKDLHEKKDAINKEIEILTIRLCKLKTEAKRVEFEQFAKMCNV
jgi:hypothetical protein